MSVEVALRGAGNGRVRVLFSYAAKDFEAIQDRSKEVHRTRSPLHANIVEVGGNASLCDPIEAIVNKS